MQLASSLFFPLQLSEATSKYQVNCQHMEKLQQSLAEEMGQRRLLEKRFQDLADNHQQMIRLKDEYKEEARGLREKVGRQEQGHRRSLELEEDMLRVQRECEEKLKSFEERLTAVQAEKDTAQSKAHQLQQKTNEAAREHVCAIQHLQMSLKGRLLKIEDYVFDSEVILPFLWCLLLV